MSLHQYILNKLKGCKLRPTGGRTTFWDFLWNPDFEEGNPWWERLNLALIGGFLVALFWFLIRFWALIQVIKLIERLPP